MTGTDTVNDSGVLGPTPRVVIGWNAFLPIASAVFTALILILFVRVFARSVAVLMLSVTIADCLAPIVRWMERRMPRTLAAALVYGALIAAGVCAFVWLGPALISECREFLGQLPELISAVQSRLNRWLPGVSLPPNFSLHALISYATDHLISLPVTVGAGLIVSVLIFFLSFYWLVAMPSIHGYIRSLFPGRVHSDVDAFLQDVGRAMGGYLRGVAINAFIVATLVWFGLHLAGVHYAFPLAVLTGTGEFVPYLGPVLASVPALMIASLQSPAKVIIVLVLYTSIMQIEGHVLTPNIMRSQTDVPQVLVIVALFAGGAIGGLLGALVAVPLAGALLVVTRRFLGPGIRKWTQAHFGYRGDEAGSK